jgi:hypothetical protein
MCLKIPKNQKKIIKITKKGNFDGLCKQLFHAINPKKSQKKSEKYCKIQIKSNKPRIIQINLGNFRKID